MAIGARFLIVLALVVGIFNETSRAQTIYNVALSGLMACKPAATLRNLPPTASCCSTLWQTHMGCLCSYKNSNILPSLGMDPNLAMQIPGKCNLTQPTSC